MGSGPDDDARRQALIRLGVSRTRHAPLSARQPVTTHKVDTRALRMLCADWLSQLGREAGLPFTQYGSSGESFTIGSPNDLHVTAHFTDDEPYLRFVSSDPTRQSQIDSLAKEAASRVRQGNLGSTVWHSATCPAPDFQLASPFSMGSFMERLGNQMSTPIQI